jgi:hypothetical protein
MPDTSATPLDRPDDFLAEYVRWLLSLESDRRILLGPDGIALLVTVAHMEDRLGKAPTMFDSHLARSCGGIGVEALCRLVDRLVKDNLLDCMDIADHPALCCYWVKMGVTGIKSASHAESPSELLPCPFCGSNVVFDNWGLHHDGPNPECIIGTRVIVQIPGAICDLADQWNARVEDVTA